MEQGSIENARNREQPPDDSGGTGEEPDESASSLLFLLRSRFAAGFLAPGFFVRFVRARIVVAFAASLALCRAANSLEASGGASLLSLSDILVHDGG